MPIKKVQTRFLYYNSVFSGAGDQGEAAEKDENEEGDDGEEGAPAEGGEGKSFDLKKRDDVRCSFTRHCDD